VSLSLQRLQEAYPELKSQGNSPTLMSQLEGTENRITIAVRDYNTAVQSYNTHHPHLPRRGRREDLLRRQADGPFQAKAGRRERPDRRFRERQLNARVLLADAIGGLVTDRPANIREIM
jgi:LemA protein